MKIGFGSDHAGFDLKEILKKYLSDKGHICIDYGTYNKDSVDYPDYAKKVAQKIIEKEVEKGVLICGTGIGMGISANKIKGIRAATCSESYSAQMSVRHNDANIITLGSRVVGEDVAKMIAEAFFDSKFEGERHEKRVAKIHILENQ